MHNGFGLVVQLEDFWVNITVLHSFGRVWGLRPSVPQLGQDLRREGLHPLLSEEGFVDLGTALLLAEARQGQQEHHDYQLPSLTSCGHGSLTGL